MDIATKLSDLRADLSECRRAITYRGGEISATAGFKEVAEKIASLPASSSIGTVVDESSSLLKIVPVDSTKYCYLKSLGGMTYKCNNLIPYPYAETTKTVKGITFTDNRDGTITVNGTAESRVAFSLKRGSVTLPKGKYYFSACPSGGSLSTYHAYLSIFNDGAWVADFSDVGNGVAVDLTNRTYTEVRLSIYIEAGTVCNNLVVKPMLNAGSTALPYEPYYEGLRDNKATAIKVSGAQLIPFPYYANRGIGNTYTLNGLTFTVNEDRTVSINGTGTALVEYTLFQGFLPAGTYTMSGLNPSNNTAYYMQMRDKDSGSFYKNAATVDGSVNRGTFTITAEEANQYYCRLNIRVLNGVAFENVKVRPMLNKGSVAVPYTDYREPITYPIPEALQGTGKGVEGASDTVDFENDNKLIKTKTVALADENYNLQYPNDNIRAWKYIAECVSLTPFNTSLAMNALCSNLPTTSTYNGTEVGVCLEHKSTTRHYISIAIPKSYLTEMPGNDDKAKLKNWLKENNVTLTYAVAEPTETDIDTSAFDNLIEVEGGGSLEIITDNGMAVPTTFIYQTIV